MTTMQSPRKTSEQPCTNAGSPASMPMTSSQKSSSGAEITEPAPIQSPPGKASVAPPRDVSDKKTEFVDFQDEEKIKEEKFAIATQKVKLSLSTLKGCSVDKTTLPEDLSYEPKELWLLSHADVLLSSQDDGDEDLAAFPAAGQSVADPSRNSSVVQDATNNESAEACTGNNLVEEPQVEKVQIQYARTPKEIDVETLKQAMWDILTCRGDENKENVDENDPSPTKMKDPIKFMQLYRSLPSRISSNMAKNLNVPVAFVCFLHLANEKNLQLINQEDMNDFTITQG